MVSPEKSGSCAWQPESGTFYPGPEAKLSVSECDS